MKARSSRGLNLAATLAAVVMLLLVDPAGRVVEILCVRAFEVAIETQPEIVRQHALSDRLFGSFQPKRDVFDRAGRFLRLDIDQPAQHDK